MYVFLIILLYQVTHLAKAEPWLRDLAGEKPLTLLAKRVQIFNKKEEIFKILCDHNVPILRGVWFIKMTNAYHTAVHENRVRQRRTIDPHGGQFSSRHVIVSCDTNLYVY